MAVNVLIKEVENLNISADDETVTVTSHDVEKVVEEPETPEDLSGGENVLSKSEIADIVKKQLEESNVQFCEMSPDDIVGLFDEFIDKGVDISAFDYKIYSRDFYAERFPGFEPRFYECLERASAEKFVDQSDKKDWRNYTYEVGEYTVSFGGVEETKDDDSTETYSDAVSDIKD
jgi:hypothetical protein